MEAQEVSSGQPKKYSCVHEKCGYQTNKLFNFQRHRKIHEKKAQLREIANHHSFSTRSPPSTINNAPSAKIQRLDIECAHQDCLYRGDQLENYVDHVLACHDKELKFVDKRFDDRESLEDFLRKLQEQTSCSMILSRTLEGSPPESFELCCSASGRYKRQSNLLQSSSDIRSGIYCTFYLSVNVFDNAIFVKGCSSHYGHEVLASSLQQNQLHTQASSTSGDESLTTEENQNICPMDDDAKSEQLVIVEEEQIIVDDDEDKKTQNFQRELRRIALDIQTETELFMETESTLSPIEYEQLERASATIVEILRTCRSRPALTTLNSDNGQSSPPTQTTRFNSTGSILPVQVPVQRHSTASLPTQRQLLAGVGTKTETSVASAQISQLHQQFLQQQQQQLNSNALLSQQLPSISLANTLTPQTALLLAATAQQRAMCNANSAQQPALATNNLLAALATLSQQQQQLSQNQAYIPPTTAAFNSLNNNNNNSIATTLQQLAHLNASSNPSPKLDEMLRKAIVEFERRSAWSTAVQPQR